MKPVASNPFYTLFVEEQKRRVYLKIIGWWFNKDDVPNWLRDLETAAKMVRPGFTILTDLTEFKGGTQQPLHVEGQKLLIKAGLSKVGEVYAQGSIVARVQVKMAAEESGMNVRQFESRSEAEAWLDRG
ncbi:MAG: hypothetical protein V2B18_03875 [Pseudomonadota bacterium]